MKPTTQAVYDTITNDYANTVGFVARAEWEMNRFYKTLVDNTPSEDTSGYDIELFPIESITKANRPRQSGLVKAVVNQAYVEPARYDAPPRVRFYTSDADDEYKYWQSPEASTATGTLANCAPQVLYANENGSLRTITANKISFVIENSYSYPVNYTVQIKTTVGGSWTTVATNIAVPMTGKVDLWYNGTNWTTTPDYAHSATVHAVRLVVTKMYVPAASRNVTVSTIRGTDVITGPGGSFTPADIGASVTGTGIQAGSTILGVQQREVINRRFILDDNSTVTATDRPANAVVEIDPIVNEYADARISKVTTATNSGVTAAVSVAPVGAYFNLISLGFCLELDVTGDVVNWNDSFSMGEDDFITPMGTVSSNTGSITLFDDADVYDNDNTNSILYGLLDKGVIFRAWMKYGDDLVPEFELYSDTWQESEDSTVVNLVDGTQFFMAQKPRPVMYRNIPVQEAVWRICDIVGYNNYKVTAVDTAPHSIIDIFWTDGQKTAWELFQELSRATQTAIYFDSFGTLQVKTREAAFDSTQEPVYDFIRDTIPGGQPANVVSLTDENQYQANQVTVNWKPTDFSEQRDNIIPFEVIWEPEGTVLLRSTPLSQDLLIGDTKIVLPTRFGMAWPWSGMCNVEGEWISFDAKQYIYYDGNGDRQIAWVTDFVSQQRLDEVTPTAQQHLNTYTGSLRVAERGLFNTEERNHYVNDLSANGWTSGRQRNYGTTNSPASGIQVNQAQSTVTISSPGNSDMNDYTYLYRGNSVNEGFWYLGTRMKIDKSTHNDKVGGIFFNADGGLGTGYFLEVMATARMNGKMRHTRNEVMFYSMKADGSKRVYGGERVTMKDKSKNNRNGATVKTDVGAQMAVVQDRYIDFDIWFSVNGSGDHVFQIWANGSLLFTATVPNGSGWQHSRIERSGLYVRGQSSVTFDYFYGINNLEIEPTDDESYFDRIDGAYRGNQAIADWTYEVRTVRRKVRRKWTKVQQKYNQRFYDEFGAMAHEIREFKVKFTSNTPVLQSKLYFSNTTQVVCPEYVGDISGAHFIMANIDRRDAVLNGDDDVTAMGNGTINHKLFVYGRPVIQKDAETIVKTDDAALRRRGIIDVEYNSDWIQNREEANNFADWLTTHWTTSDAKVEIEVFGNPLIELTDVVTLTYKNKVNVKFYVIGVSNSYENGLSTTLTLRQA